MLANQEELRTDVRSLINERTEAFWLDAEIDRWLDEAQEEFSSRVRALVSHYRRTVDGGEVVNGREIRFASDFVALAEGGVVCNGRPLSWISLTALDEWGGDWRTREGEPERFYLRADAVGFFPAPREGDVIEYYGIERAAALGDSTAPLSGDYRLITFRRSLRDYAASRCWEKKGEVQKALWKMGEFEQAVNRALGVVYAHQAEGARVIPGYRTRGSVYAIRYGHTGSPIS